MPNFEKQFSHVSRRRFLMGTGAAAGLAGLPGWLTPSALAINEVPANEKISVGIIGGGIQGRHVMRHGIIRDPAFRITAVCDVDRNRCDHLADFVNRVYGSDDCEKYIDYRELLERSGVDAVVIATPDHWHTTQVIHAAMAGKDIYCEKPLTHTLHESKQIVEAVEKHKVILQTGSQQRTEFSHIFVKAVEYIRAGRLGKIDHVRIGVQGVPVWCDLPAQDPEEAVDWDRWLGPAPQRPYHADLSPRGVHGHYPTWRNYREYAGGGIADIGAHHFDIAQWALDRDTQTPTEIIPPEDPEATTGTQLVYEDGVRLIHGGCQGVLFVGEHGSLNVDRGMLVSDPASILEQPLTEDDPQLPRYDKHAANWRDCIRSRADPICNARVGATSAAICHLTNLAYHTRERLVWDPKAWQFKNSEAANRLLDYQRRAGYELPEA